MKLVFTEKEFKIFDKKLKKHFELTRIEYEKKKKNNSFEYPDLTRTYKQDMHDAMIIKNILYLHDNKMCSCTSGNDCWYSLYRKNLVTEKEILSEFS